jgi:hypothetical protein
LQQHKRLIAACRRHRSRMNLKAEWRGVMVTGKFLQWDRSFLQPRAATN